MTIAIEVFPGGDGLGIDPLGALPLGGAGTTGMPLQTVIPSYLYAEYATDKYLKAFINAYNAIAQGYLNWFTATPLGIWTSDAISGPLLDWCANGLYGIPRPIILTPAQTVSGAFNAVPFNTVPFNTNPIVQSSTAIPASDDIYKRTLTWILYLGDGKQISLTWLKKRLARFLYGTNGTDISVDQIWNVSIAASMWPNVAAPTVTPTGTAGTTDYSYEVVAIPSYGGATSGAITQTATGNATLSSTNYNALSWTAPTGGTGTISYNVYRTASSGSPSTTGLIASGLTATSFDDTGIAGDGTTPPIVNVSLLYTVALPSITMAQTLKNLLLQGILPLPLGPWWDITIS